MLLGYLLIGKRLKIPEENIKLNIQLFRYGTGNFLHIRKKLFLIEICLLIGNSFDDVIGLIRVKFPELNYLDVELNFFGNYFPGKVKNIVGQCSDTVPFKCHFHEKSVLAIQENR